MGMNDLVIDGMKLSKTPSKIRSFRFIDQNRNRFDISPSKENVKASPKNAKTVFIKESKFD